MRLSLDKTILRKIELSDIDDEGYLKVPDSVITIEDATTYNDVRRALKTIDISNVEEIGAHAFKLCTELEAVIGAPKSIDKSAFSNCVKLKTIDLSQVIRLGSAAFSSCDSLEKIDIRNLENISDEAFISCSNLSEIYGAPETVGDRVFKFCWKLKSFDFSKILDLGLYSFSDCGLLTADVSRLASIPEGTFCGCTSLKQITGAPLSIGRKAFWGCRKLRILDFSKLNEIGYQAFLGSAFEESVVETKKTVHIESEGFRADYAKAFETSVGEKVGCIIDENRNAYCDETGQPFIFNKANLRKVFLNEEKELFIKLWNAS